MKRLMYLSVMAFFLTSCYIDNTVQPRYDARDRVTGYYDVEEYSETYDEYTYYSISVRKSSYHDEIYLDNFYGVDISVYAYVDYDDITIPLQEHDGYRIEGVGSMNGSTMHLTYSVRDTYSNTRTDFCQSVAR